MLAFRQAGYGVAAAGIAPDQVVNPTPWRMGVSRPTVDSPARPLGADNEVSQAHHGLEAEGEPVVARNARVDEQAVEVAVIPSSSKRAFSAPSTAAGAFRRRHGGLR